MESLNTLSLDGLNPLSDVTTAVDKGTLLSTPRITNPVAGNVYVFKRGKKQWNDGLKWPFKIHKHAQNGRDHYQIYHGVDARHLSGSHAPSLGDAYACRCPSRR